MKKIIYLLIFFIVIAVSTSYRIGSNLILRYTPLINSFLQIKIDAIEMHSHYRDKKFFLKTDLSQNDFNDRKKRVFSALDSMLSDEKAEEISGVALKEASLRYTAKECEKIFNTYVSLLAQVSNDDQRMLSDVNVQSVQFLFDDFIHQIEYINTSLQGTFEKEKFHYQLVNIVLFSLVLILLVLFFVLFNRHHKFVINQLEKNEQSVKEIKEKSDQVKSIAERFHRLIDFAPEIILLVDQKGKIRDCNKKVLSICNYSKKFVLNKSLEDFIIMPSFENMTVTGKIFEREYLYHQLLHLKKKDGGFIEVSLSSSLVKDYTSNELIAVCILEDVTERLKAETTNKKNLERYKRLFNAMRSGVAVYEPIQEGDDFVFVDFNHAAEEIEGITRNEVIGKVLTEIFPGVNELGLLDVFKRVNKTGEAEFLPAAFYNDNEREGSWRENWIYKLSSGEIVAVYDDVTKRKAAEAELEMSRNHLEVLVKERTQQLMQSEKLATIGRLVASIAHEINNPLQGITTHLGILEDISFEDFKNDESYTCIKEGLQRIKNIVKQLLDVFRGKDEVRSNFIVNHLITKVINLVQSKLEIHNIEVEVVEDNKNIRFFGVESQLHQVILNLLLNAIDAAKPNTKIIISLFSKTDVVEIWVQDSGEGIQESISRQIFDPFFTTKSNTGIGLGLFVCQQLVQNHNGKILLDSAKSKGTIFKVVLPRKNN